MKIHPMEFGTMVVDWEERINPERLRSERLTKAKAALKKSEADALLIFRLEDVRYITGLRTHLGPVPFLGLAAVFLPKGGEPVLFTMDADHAKARMPWIPKENIRPLVHGIIEGYEGAIRAWAEANKDVFKKVTDGVIGIDLLTPGLYNALKAVFPKMKIIYGEPILMEAKKTKTSDEIECLRTVSIITEAGFEAALEALKPGVRECEVLAEAWRAMTRLGSEWTQCANIVCSGPYTAPYRRLTSDRIIRTGDLVIIDIGGCFNGYWGDYTRVYVCGDVYPTKEQIKLHQECYDALFTAIERCKPGNTTADVYKALVPPHDPQALSLGHGSGLGCWEAPWFTKASLEFPETLQAGMYFSLEPYNGEVGVGGFRLENNVLITEDGPEVISTFPFDERLLEHTHPLDKTTGRSIRYPRIKA
jgi:Xaa-Pro aminopeptidase